MSSAADTQRSLVEQIVAAKTDKFAEASVYLDGQAWADALALRALIAETRRSEIMESGPDALAFPLQSAIPGQERQLMELLAGLESSEVVFTFAALPHDAYETLLDAHQDDDPDNLWGDDFPVALIAATCTKVRGPDMAYDQVTVEEVEALRGVFDRAQFGGLFKATYELQSEAPAPFTYAATAKTRGSEQSSTGASDSKASHTAGS